MTSSAAPGAAGALTVPAVRWKSTSKHQLVRLSAASNNSKQVFCSIVIANENITQLYDFMINER